MALLPQTSKAAQTGLLPSGVAPGGLLPGFSVGALTTPPGGFGLGSAGSLQETLTQYGGSSLGQYMTAQQQQLMANAGLDPETADPEDLMNAETARAQNEATIAKIATVNPEAAAQLSAQLLGEPEDEGFFESMKGFFGDLIAPAVSVGAKALDILTRPGRIIPELIVDKEEDPWYEDIGQALSGNSTAHGADVLDKWGVENNWAKGIGGFILDVAVDPITYIGVGALGRTTREVAEHAGRKVGEHALRRGLVATAKHGDDEIRALSREFGTRLTNLAEVNADVLPGMVAQGLSHIPSELVTEAATRAQKVAGLITKGQRLRGKVDPEDIALLEDLAKGGGLAGRQAAAAIGGVRAVAGVPFSQLRWTSAAIPFTERVGFKVFGNFFRGTSGMKRLEQASRMMPEAEKEALIRTYITKGFKGVADENPLVMQELGGGPLNLGSMYMEASHRMGRVTGWMSPHASSIRAEGLAGIASFNAGRHAASIKRQLYDDSLVLFKDDYGGADSGVELARKDVIKKLQPIADLPDKQKIINWLETVPSRELAEMDDVALKDSLLSSFRTKKDVAEELAGGDQKRLLEIYDDWERQVLTVDNRITDMKKAHDLLTPAEKEAAEVYRRLTKQIMVEGDKRGVSALDRTVSLDFADRLSFSQLDEWAFSGRKDLREAAYGKEGTGLFVDIGDEAAIRSHHIKSNGEGLGRGYRFTTEGGETGHRAAVRLQRPAIDRPGAASDSGTIKTAFKAAREDVDNQRDLLTLNHRELNLEDNANWAKFSDDLVDTLATEKLKVQGFDGVVRYDKNDKILEGVAFENPKMRNVKLVDESTARINPDRGYFPHIMTDAAFAQKKGASPVTSYGKRQAVFAHEHARIGSDKLGPADRELAEQLGLKEGQKALMDDPLEVLERYAERFSDEAASRTLGAAGKSFHAAYGSLGKSVNLNRYDSLKGFLGRDNFARLSKSEKQAYEKVMARQGRLLEQEERTVQELAQQKAVLENAEILRTGKGRLASSARQKAGADFNVATKVQNRINQLNARIARLKKTKDTEGLQKATEELEGLKVLRDEFRKGKFVPTSAEQAAKHAEWLEKHAARLETTAGKTALRTDQLRRQLDGAFNELNKVRTRIDTESAKALPAAMPSNGKWPGYVDMSQVPALKGLAFHPHIAQEFVTSLRGRELSVIQQEWRRWLQGPWKRWATIYYPGFHARNNLGAWFNNWLGGVSVQDYRDSVRISHALEGRGKWADVNVPSPRLKEWGLGHEKSLTYRQLGERLHAHGVRAANSQALADAGSNVLEWRRLQETGRIARGVSKVTGPARSLAQSGVEVTENLHRQAAFLAGLRQTDGSFAGARMSTMVRHGDYEDLNDFEEIAKDIIPFYKWMRTNVPYQIHQLTQVPGKTVATLKARDAAYFAQGYDPDEMQRRQPHWLKEAWTVPTPFKGEDGVAMLSLDLPYSDLYQGANDYLSSFLPLVMPFIESKVLKQSVFTGGPIEDKPVALAGWAKLPGIRQALDPFITTDAEGNETIKDSTQHIMRAIPVFSRFRNWVFGDEKSQKGRASALASAALGVRWRNDGPEELEAHELAFFYEEVEPYVSQLRKLGVALPQPSHISPEVFDYLGFTPPKTEGGATSSLLPQ